MCHANVQVIMQLLHTNIHKLLLETLGENMKCELHKGAMCYFEKVLEVSQP